MITIMTRASTATTAPTARPVLLLLFAGLSDAFDEVGVTTEQIWEKKAKIELTRKL